MKGSATNLVSFMEGTDKRFVIPVYQRKYDWRVDNCRQLYEDLKKVARDGRGHHFFGSIVSQVVGDGARTEYRIIDGQQRLTTVTLLLLAVCAMVRSGRVESERENLADMIMNRYIVDEWNDGDDRIKLRPVRADRDALRRLVAGDPDEFEPASNLTINYRFFCKQITKGDVSVDDLFAAVGRLQVISITLDGDDNAQLIFESLNSTGLALTEGDKIRNYVLMGLDPREQDEVYEKYWTKIEECAGSDVSAFVRDYLSIKRQMTPTIGGVYRAFKEYVGAGDMPLRNVLDDMLGYARIYRGLLDGESGFHDRVMDGCMYRLRRLEITVAEPFLMEVLRLARDGAMSESDAAQVFLIVETYLFRRSICDVPTNSLNKVFLMLNREVMRFDGTADDYLNKFVYALLSKKESSRFPDDEEFAQALANKAVYQMRGRYRAYLFERFENHGTLEAKDVYTLLDNGTYSIEHIMPQHLTPAWAEELGPDAEEIHDTWLHRLGNLTLTAYNSNMSNATFREKRDAERGYAESGLRMNQRIATKDRWGVEEMQERSDEMVSRAVSEIWPMPSTTFTPVQKELDAYTLDDDTSLTGRDIVRYGYQGKETPVSSWADMFEHVVKYLHGKDGSVLLGIAYGDGGELGGYFSGTPDRLHMPLEIGDGVYAEKHTSTAVKISILRRLFVLFREDPTDLVFYLRDSGSEESADEKRYALRKRYWEYALPVIKDANRETGCFDGCNPIVWNTTSGSFGMGGFMVNCVANKNEVRVELYLGKKDAEENRRAFDYLFSRSGQIEQVLGTRLMWNRSGGNKTSKAAVISTSLRDVAIANDADWSRMAEFMAQWSRKYLDVFVPILEDLYGGKANGGVAVKE